MKKNILIICLLLAGIPYLAIAQKKQLQVLGGWSKHGSGDLTGFYYGFNYSKYVKPKLSWQVSFEGNMYDGFFPLYYTNPNSGVEVDGSYRYSIAGIQLGYNGRYSFVKKANHEAIVSIGAFLRYQSSSASDAITVIYPIVTNLPIPVFYFENETPVRTVAVGAYPKIEYSYTLKKKITIGMIAGFQFDTNGDNIMNLSLTLGKRF
ncbi:MAG: hypothetical protein K2Q24_03200 [Chitinophagaceae bacterium]|jgi:hypothetical protein|nr:hypothetical protein [Chitinophagaceae bacterium]